MQNPGIKYGIMFIVLVLIQVLLLNQVQFSGYINPYIYILFIMLLPLNTARYLALILAFFMGITIDVFSNTPGLHSCASVFIAYIRPGIIRLTTNREEDMNNYPGLAQTGISWFLRYAVIMVLAHHIVFFFVEVFTLNNFPHTLLRAVLSAVFSIFVIILSQFIIFRD